MKTYYIAFAVTMVCSTLSGAESGSASRIAPFIDSQTVGIGRLDLTRVAVDPLVDRLIELVPDARAEQARVRQQLKELHGALVNSGAKELYVVISLNDVPHRPPFVFVPDVAEGQAKSLATKLPSPPEQVVEPIRGGIFIGSRETLERLRGLQPDARTELAAAFQTVADTTAQLLLLPSADARRVVEELLPNLPVEIGGGPSTILTQGLQWAALGVSAPPQLSLRLVVQSKDAAAATALRTKLQELFQILARFAAKEPERPVMEQRLAALLPQLKADRLELMLADSDQSIQALLGLLQVPLEQARSQGRRAQSMNNLKQLGLAMHIYYDRHKHFPAVGTADPSGKPLLSWRVEILPFIDQQTLYDKFHHDEPWDSEHNRQLIAAMPPVFRCPSSKHEPSKGMTVYREITGDHTVFPGKQGIEMKQIPDGTSATLMLAEVDDEHAVVWTQPEGLPLNAKNPAAGLGGQFPGGFNALICDGSVRFVKLPSDLQNLRRLILRDDGESIDWSKL